ncbi:MAG: AMP-binding protein [Baekduia sp.]
MNLWDQLLHPPRPDNVLHTWTGDRFEAATWGEVTALAERKAAGLRALGVGPGSNVACVLTNTRDVCASILGIWMAGGTVVSLPVPARGMAVDDYKAQVGRICRQVDAQLLLTEERFAAALELLEDGPAGAVYERLDGDPGAASPPALDAPALIQYSSGTTEEPRGCILTADAIGSHLVLLREKMEADPDRDMGVAWLPLSHDMGLFGALMIAWVWGGNLALGTPERFLASPRTWVQDCADFGATITVGPTFAVKLAARAAAISPPEGDLKLRIWIVGSDHVEVEALDAIHAALGPSGLTRAAMTPAYGLAEATLAVTMAPPAEEPASMVVDAKALLAGTLSEVPAGHPDARRIVASGTPLRDTEVRIDAERHAELASPGFGRAVGEICIRTPSLASGYHARPDKTAERFRDGEFRTGDLGFLDGDQLYVLGRIDDMFVVAGRNIHAGELEELVMREPGVRPGGVALVDMPDDHDRVVCLLETESGFEGAREELAAAISDITLAHAGVRVRECVFVARGALPKTPSGKVQRYRCRALAVADDERVLERISF